jgi:hypothetical protein
MCIKYDITITVRYSVIMLLKTVTLATRAMMGPECGWPGEKLTSSSFLFSGSSPNFSHHALHIHPQKTN